MTKQNFTVARVENLNCELGKQQSFYWDAKTPGFGIRATASGTKSYIFESRLFGKTVRITIGNTRTWELGHARSEALRLKTLTDAGKDPREIKDEERAAFQTRLEAKAQATLIFETAWNDYVDSLSVKLSPKTKQPRSAAYVNDHRRFAAPGGECRKRGDKKTQRGALYPLMAMKLSNLTVNVVSNWLESEVPNRPTTAAYAFRMLKAFMRWCESHDQYGAIIPAGSCSSPKVTNVLPRIATKSGDSLQREQLLVWFKAVRALHNPVQSAYLQGLLITGARREELASLRWEDVDFRWRSLHLNDKIESETGRVIPLTPYFASLLLELQTLNNTPPTKRRLEHLAATGREWAPSPWVFHSLNSAEGRIAEPRYAHNRALHAAGLPHISLHGLRRSFGTLSEWCEVPVGVVAQIQGHKPSALAEKHYRRRPLDMLRMWHDKIEAWILEQAQISGPALAAA